MRRYWRQNRVQRNAATFHLESQDDLVDTDQDDKHRSANERPLLVRHIETLLISLGTARGKSCGGESFT